MYHGSPKRVLLVLLVICLQICVSFAQGKNFFISKNDPSWIVKINARGEQLKPKDVTDGYYLSLYEDQNHAELQENYIHIIRQIISGAGVQHGSQVTVTYDPSYQKVTFHKLIVWRNNQPADQLKASNFKVQQNEKELSRFIYSGTYDAFIILDDIRKGDRIEYAYTIKGENPIFGNAYTNTFYLENSTSVGHKYTNLITSQNRQLKFKNFNFNTSPKITEKNGMKVYEWENRLTGTYRYGDYEPSWYNPYKYTQVTSYANWPEVVDWGIKTNSYTGLKTPLVEEKVKELWSKAKGDTSKYMLLATRFVQDEIRYMGVEMGVYSQRPNSPEKVLQQRYGDCKDKSLLLVYLLKMVNVKAFMAYVDTYAGKKTSDFLPSPTLFNHVVVMVDHHHVQTWIDPTISYQRGSFENTYFPNYGQALVLREGTYKPEEVVSIATGKLIADLTFKVGDTAKSARTTLLIQSVYTDNYADNIRSLIASDGEEGIDKSFLEYIDKYYSGAESVSPVNIKDNEDTNTIEITESYTISNMWSKEKSSNPRDYTYFYGDLISTNLRTITARNRTAPVALKHPTNVEENISIDLPFSPSLSNESYTVETDNYYFELNTFVRGRNVKLNYAYRSLTDEITSSDIKKYISDTERINELLSYSIIWHSADPGANLNPYMVLLVILTIAGSSFYFIRIHQQKSDFTIEELANAKPIGHWLVLLAIVLILILIGLPTSVVRLDLFNNQEWDVLLRQANTLKFSLGATYILEAIAYGLKFNWTLLLLILFFNRRKEFPLQLFRYSIFTVAIMAFHLIAQLLIGVTKTSITNISNYFTQIVISSALLFFWLRFLKRSSRIKDTFVFTYPESYWKDQLHKFRFEHKRNPYINTNNTHTVQQQHAAITDDNTTDHENL